MEGDKPVSVWERWTEQIALRYPFSLSILCALCVLLFLAVCWRFFLCSVGVVWVASLWRFSFPSYMIVRITHFGK